MDGDSDLIAAIYDAIIDPSRWDEVVRRIVEATKSNSGVIATHQVDPLAPQINPAQLAVMCNIDPFYADAFVQTYDKINPINAAVRAVAPGQVLAASYITQTEGFKASRFYNEFYCPQRQADSIGIGLIRTPGAAVYLGIQRSPGAIWVEPKEWHLLETLAPHLKRAAEVHQLLSRARAVTESLGAAVTAAGFAVFLLTGDCRVLFANAKAEDLVRLGIGLRYEHGRLAAATPALTQRLHALARDAARPNRAGGDVAGTLELPRGENCPPLAAHVIPLGPNRAVSIFDIDRPAAAVFAVDPAANLGAQIRRFAAKFGLTPAETRVAGEIIGGNGLLTAAAHLNITEATVRTHAKHIFDKTGVHRQPELVRRFFETAFPGSPASL